MLRSIERSPAGAGGARIVVLSIHPRRVSTDAEPCAGRSSALRLGSSPCAGRAWCFALARLRALRKLRVMGDADPRRSFADQRGYAARAGPDQRGCPLHPHSQFFWERLRDVSSAWSLHSPGEISGDPRAIRADLRFPRTWSPPSARRRAKVRSDTEPHEARRQADAKKRSRDKRGVKPERTGKLSGRSRSVPCARAGCLTRAQSGAALLQPLQHRRNESAERAIAHHEQHVTLARASEHPLHQHVDLG